MTDRIDLDEMDVDSEEPDANYGDWFWRDEGDPDAEPDPDEGWLDAAGTGGFDGADGDGTTGDDRADTVAGDGDETEGAGDEPDGASDDETAGDGAEASDGGEDGANDGDERDHDPVPGVPRSNRDRPVGVPVESGGAGGAGGAGGGATSGSAVSGDSGGAGDGTADASGAGPATGSGDTADVGTDTTDAATDAGSGEGGMASGPHGGGVDDMTLALTYEAAQRLADPRFAVIEAKSWTDWIGIVGDVPAYEINRFQREHEIDVDFFSGAGQEPAERLADVDEHSMFYAERLALVGIEGEEGIAERAGWEFVPLETAAEKADWDLADPEPDQPDPGEDLTDAGEDAPE